MAIINPNLASVALNMQNQQNSNPFKTMDTASEDTQSEKNSVINNSSVTLSASIENASNDYLDLKSTQTTNETTQTNLASNETSNKASDLTYASDLQTKNNYFSVQNNTQKSN